MSSATRGGAFQRRTLTEKPLQAESFCCNGSPSGNVSSITKTKRTLFRYFHKPNYKTVRLCIEAMKSHGESKDIPSRNPRLKHSISLKWQRLPRRHLSAISVVSWHSNTKPSHLINQNLPLSSLDSVSSSLRTRKSCYLETFYSFQHARSTI